MILWKTLRRIAFTLFALSTMLLLGVRFYESTYIYSTEVMTVTHILTPLMIPVMGVSLVAFIIFGIVTAILSGVQKRKQRKNNI